MKLNLEFLNSSWKTVGWKTREILLKFNIMKQVYKYQNIYTICTSNTNFRTPIFQAIVGETFGFDQYSIF